MQDNYKKSKRTFTSLVRRPYKEWHYNMARRLKSYTIDLKDYIVRLEDGHDRENTET